MVVGEGFGVLLAVRIGTTVITLCGEEEVVEERLEVYKEAGDEDEEMSITCGVDGWSTTSGAADAGVDVDVEGTGVQGVGVEGSAGVGSSDVGGTDSQGAGVEVCTTGVGGSDVEGRGGQDAAGVEGSDDDGLEFSGVGWGCRRYFCWMSTGLREIT
jgi:hypothetical protein